MNNLQNQCKYRGEYNVMSVFLLAIHSLMKMSKVTPKRLNFVNFLASVCKPEPCRLYLATQAFTNIVLTMCYVSSPYFAVCLKTDSCFSLCPQVTTEIAIRGKFQENSHWGLICDAANQLHNVRILPSGHFHHEC